MTFNISLNIFSTAYLALQYFFFDKVTDCIYKSSALRLVSKNLQHWNYIQSEIKDYP